MTQLTKTDLAPWIACCLGRRDDYAIQLTEGRYVRTKTAPTYQVLTDHLLGVSTIGTYVINEQGGCTFAVFDSDTPDGLNALFLLQARLAVDGIPSYVEQSRRGGHCWVFFDGSFLPEHVRAWLRPYCPADMEFYPKQDQADWDRPGSLIRLPLGVHRLSHTRYPFVQLVQGQPVPVAASVFPMLTWFATVERVRVPEPALVGQPVTRSGPPPQKNIPFKNVAGRTSVRPWSTIAEWCQAHDPVAVIGRYVDLDAQGLGCCPFGFHHADGVDQHPSLWVYRPASPSDLMCWYCHTWKQGGSLFDFLRVYYSLEARDLWLRLQAGAQF